MRVVTSAESPPQSREWHAGPIGLVASLVVVAIVALAGTSWTDTAAGSWYDALRQPWWNPPDWLFGPVWSVLYLMMAVAAWLVARTGLDRPAVQIALTLYVAQLALNLGWTGVFFGLERPAWALVEILVLLVVILATIRAFARSSRGAAALLVPYALWVTYAACLNAAIVALN